MKRDKTEMSRPLIYPDDAKYLKQVLGKEFDLVTYADIVHQIVLNDQMKEKTLTKQIENGNLNFELLKDDVKKLQGKVDALTKQIKAMSLMQSALIELAGDYMHRKEYNLANPDYGYLARGTGTDSGE